MVQVESDMSDPGNSHSPALERRNFESSTQSQFNSYIPLSNSVEAKPRPVHMEPIQQLLYIVQIESGM